MKSPARVAIVVEEKVQPVPVGKLMVFGSFAGVASFDFVEGDWGYLLPSARSTLKGPAYLAPGRHKKPPQDVLGGFGVSVFGCGDRNHLPASSSRSSCFHWLFISMARLNTPSDTLLLFGSDEMGVS